MLPMWPLGLSRGLYVDLTTSWLTEKSTRKQSSHMGIMVVQDNFPFTSTPAPVGVRAHNTE